MSSCDSGIIVTDEKFYSTLILAASSFIAAKVPPMGYVVVRKRDGHFYKGEVTIRGKQVAQWRTHVKFAKVYSKRGWAEKAAAKWKGVVKEVRR